MKTKPYSNIRRLWKLAVVLAAFCFVLGGLLPAATASSVYSGKSAKYVFLFIGDGMGIPQRTAAEKYVNKRLVMDNMPAQGITTTYAADRFITGSAASATALGCGQKTKIGMIGMAPDMRPFKSVAEIAKERGMKVGIISSVSIDHATPAAFYAHVPKRSQYYDIDVAISESNFDFFGGGGLKDPTNKRKSTAQYKGDAIDLLKKAGYKVISDKSAFMTLKPSDGKVLAYNAWLQDSGALPYAMDTRAEDISITEFTAKAIEMLDNPDGFFLMVEGGKIDWACHANDAAGSIHDTLAFDQSVALGIEFAKAHPDETLVVVTGDHECGGLTLGWAGTNYDTNFSLLCSQKVSFQKFTDEILKKFKSECGGNCTFDAIKPVITANFGLKFSGDAKADPMVLKPYQIAQLEEAFARSVEGEKTKSSDPQTALLYGGYDPLAVALTHVLNNKAGLGWTSYKHTGVPVSTSALGVGEASFNGYYDNTDVAKKIMAIMGVAPQVYFVDVPETLQIAAK